jgi:glucosamine--fructose-6-phosphate aminotransferase (isomerizing)
MCGIIAYIGKRPAAPILVEGLKRLEYRGYDSAGLALLDGGLERIRTVGNVSQLARAVEESSPGGNIGIAHTRWATHGRVSEENAHPLSSCEGSGIMVVMNGIIENFRPLRSGLEVSGHHFASETDTEVISHLIESYYEGDLIEAVRRASDLLQGHYAFVAIHEDHPDTLVATRKHCPLLAGAGEDGYFISSSASAFLHETREVLEIEDGEIIVITREKIEIISPEGFEIERGLQTAEWANDATDKGLFDTFMRKEINEQPQAIRATLEGRLNQGEINFESLGLSDAAARDLKRIIILACGTAYHAGLAGSYMLEKWARISVDVEVASEWRYRDPILDKDTLVIGISQSGETADTLAALRLAKSLGAKTIAITNMPGSQITREADSVLLTRCGIEMGVAATKTFSSQVALIAALTLHLASQRATLPPEEIKRLTSELELIPQKMIDYLDVEDPTILMLADEFSDRRFFFFLGRHIGLPVCLEGALKLKEITYIPTESYAAGEMKHGPIALLDENTPVVAVANNSPIYDKLVSNLQEVRARGAQVIAIGTEGNEDIALNADHVLYIPECDPMLSPLLAIIPLQLLSYEIARNLGLNVDQPRNLAKTVTVE